MKYSKENFNFKLNTNEKSVKQELKINDQKFASMEAFFYPRHTNCIAAKKLFKSHILFNTQAKNVSLKNKENYSLRLQM